MKNTRTFAQNLRRSLKFLGIIAGVLFIGLIVLVVIANTVALPTPATRSQSSHGEVQTVPTAHATSIAPKPTAVPTKPPVVKPTAKPAQITPAQLEAVYKLSTHDTTATAIDKNGSAGKDSDQHFTSTIIAFVKDASGRTGGANLSDADSSSIIQVIFTPGTDITQLNTGDTLEVWGQNLGVFSGSNSFGATVQEVGIQANYMTDTTTGYAANS